MSNDHQDPNFPSAPDGPAVTPPPLPDGHKIIAAYQGLLRLLARRLADILIARHKAPVEVEDPFGGE